MPEHKTLSAPYEPLKPPEYKRNELGQFDRPGKMLAKTAKKTGLKKNPDDIKRDDKGRWEHGHGGAREGAGRKKGVPNRITVALKEAILLALDKLGGPDYLVALGRENSSAFASLLGKVLPTTLATSESNGGNVEIRFIREIVYPNHVENEGVTPKALPSPDAASPTLPRPTDPTDDTNEGAVR